MYFISLRYRIVLKIFDCTALYFVSPTVTYSTRLFCWKGLGACSSPFALPGLRATTKTQLQFMVPRKIGCNYLSCKIMQKKFTRSFIFIPTNSNKWKEENYLLRSYVPMPCAHMVNRFFLFKGIPKLKTNFQPLKRMNILRYKALKKIIFDFFFSQFFSFFNSEQKALQVKKKCVEGQGKVYQGSRRSALGLLLNGWYSAEALLLDPQCTFPWPRRTSPWTLTHFSLTPDTLLLDLKGFFSELKNLKIGKEKFKNIFETLYILKYSYALVVQS